MLKKNDTVPNFSLIGIGANGEKRKISLSEFKGKDIVLYFYPKDGTKDCTIEACNFRDSLNIINRAIIIGISGDSIDDHSKFHKEQLLNFYLLSDTDFNIAKLFDAWDEKTQSCKRQTFLLNGDFKIIKEWRDIDVINHATEIAKFLY